MKNITIESNGYELEVHYFAVESPKRSEERRVEKECSVTCSSRGWRGP